MSRAASGRARAAEAWAIAARRVRSCEQLAGLVGEAGGGQLGVGDHDRGAAVGHPAGVRRLVVGGGGRVRDQDRRSAVGGDLEDRAAGAGDHEVGGEQRLAELVDVLAQVVVRAGRGRARGSRARRRRAGRGTSRRRTPRRAAWLIERAPSEPPNTSTTVSSGASPKRARAAARSVAGGGHRPPGDAVALAARARRAGTPGRRAAAKGASRRLEIAEVRVGLGQHQRDPQQHGREADRPRHVPARRPSPRRLSARAAGAPSVTTARGGEQRGPRRLQRVAAVEPRDADRAQLVAGRRHQLAPPPAPRRRRRPRRPQPAARLRPPAPARRAPPSRRRRSRSAAPPSRRACAVATRRRVDEPQPDAAAPPRRSAAARRTRGSPSGSSARRRRTAAARRSAARCRARRRC